MRNKRFEGWMLAKSAVTGALAAGMVDGNPINIIFDTRLFDGGIVSPYSPALLVANILGWAAQNIQDAMSGNTYGAACAGDGAIAFGFYINKKGSKASATCYVTDKAGGKRFSDWIDSETKENEGAGILGASTAISSLVQMGLTMGSLQKFPIRAKGLKGEPWIVAPKHHIRQLMGEEAIMTCADPDDKRLVAYLEVVYAATHKRDYKNHQFVVGGNPLLEGIQLEAFYPEALGWSMDKIKGFVAVIADDTVKKRRMVACPKGQEISAYMGIAMTDAQPDVVPVVLYHEKRGLAYVWLTGPEDAEPLLDEVIEGIEEIEGEAVELVEGSGLSW